MRIRGNDVRLDPSKIDSNDLSLEIEMPRGTELTEN